MVLILSILFLMCLCACGSSKKTFGEVSKGLKHPDFEGNPVTRFIASLPKEKQDRLDSTILDLKERGSKATYKAIRDYGVLSSHARIKSEFHPIDKNYVEYNMWSADPDAKKVILSSNNGIANFKFYKINLMSGNSLPKNESDITVEEIHPKTFEKFSTSFKKGKEPPDVLYYLQKGEFGSQSFFILADKFYLAVPYFGIMNKDHEIPVTVFVIEPADLLKIKEIDSSYSKSFLLAQLSEDMAHLMLMINGSFAAAKDLQNIRDEYNAWSHEDFIKRHEQPHAPLNNNNRAQQPQDSGNKSKFYNPIDTPKSVAINKGVVRATSSSALKESDRVYSASNIVDGDNTTCWADGVSGLGIGESITISFDKNYEINGFRIFNGHQKSEDLFNKNSRPIALRVIGSDGSNEVYSFEDSIYEQDVTFKKPINVNSIKLVIEKVARGSKYEDTCIAEVIFF